MPLGIRLQVCTAIYTFVAAGRLAGARGARAELYPARDTCALPITQGGIGLVAIQQQGSRPAGPRSSAASSGARAAALEGLFRPPPVPAADSRGSRVSPDAAAHLAAGQASHLFIPEPWSCRPAAARQVFSFWGGGGGGVYRIRSAQVEVSFGSQPSHACACFHRRFWATSPYLFSAMVLSLGTPILGLPIEFYDIEASGN